MRAKVLERGVLNRSDVSVTGVVDQYIEFSESPNGSRHGLTCLRFAGDIERERQHEIAISVLQLH